MGFESETTYYNEMLESCARIENIGVVVPAAQTVPIPEDLQRYDATLEYSATGAFVRYADVKERLARAEATIAGLVEVVTIMWDAMNDKAHAWIHARKWLDEHDIYHGDLQENAVLAEVCKVSLTCAAGKES